VLVDHVGVGTQRNTPANEGAPGVAVAQLAHRDLDHRGNLRLGGVPRLAGGDEPDEGIDRESRRDGRGRLQGTEDLDAGGIQADLLAGLPQRGMTQVAILGIPAAAGEGDLAGVTAEILAALGQDDVRLPVLTREQRDENRGRGRAMDLERTRALGIKQNALEASAEGRIGLSGARG
jgi:hypothetical protein